MRGVGFDFDHTLGVDNKLERRALLEVLEAQDLQDEITEQDLGELVDETLHDYRAGIEELDSALTDLFARSLNAGFYDPAELIMNFRELAVELAPEHIEALPGARELFAKLTEAGIRTAILTNGWAPLQQKKAELIGYLGPVLVSDELGFRKPDGRAFTALSTTLELPAAEILYVGDAPAIDITGALKAGMHAAWYDWEKHAYPDGIAKPSWTIKSLAEVAELVLGAARSR